MSTPTLNQPRALPGPGKLSALGTTIAFQRAPLDFLKRNLDRHGNIFQIPMLGFSSVYLHHPDYIKRVLQEKHRSYDKGGPMAGLVEPLLGQGLATNIGGDPWKKRRQLMQPAFHKQQLDGIGQVVTSLSEQMLANWHTTAAADATVDVVQEMSDLALKVVVKALFSLELSDEKQAIFRHAITEAQAEMAAFLRLPVVPLSVPTPSHRRFWRSIKIVNDMLYEIIAEYRDASQPQQTDILSMLLAARDSETGEALSDKELRDELVTMFFAGHETSAKTLGWFWYILAKHPDIEDQVRAEVDSVLGGRVPAMADLPKLVYTNQVVHEALRLYAPTWMLSRRAREEDEIGGFRVPKGSEVVWSPFLLHRDPEFWPDPEKVDPERFAPDKMKTMHKGAYIPFSIGPRICIGNMFALTEIQLVVATVIQHYQLRLADSRAVDPSPELLLIPERPIHMRLVPR